MVNGVPHVQIWTPRNRASTYQYEIFAPGGIDINLSLGSANRYSNQNEVTFPGGILPQYIRTAREFDANGRLVQIWSNGGFANPNLAALPDPICGPAVRVRAWTGSEDRTITVVDPISEDHGDKTYKDGAMVTTYSVEAFTHADACKKALSDETSGIVTRR
jgi:hypothetical protein